VNDEIKNAVAFFICALGVALVVLAIWAGGALVFANGASQTCARSGGQWYATDTPQGAGVDRVRECRQ
jgi:hypothetical protein